MRPYIIAIDDFFEPLEFDLLRSYAWSLEYKDQVSPLDGQTYKNIGLPVPGGIEQKVAMQLSWIMGYKVVPKCMAFRLSLEDSNPPQWAHSDLEGSQYNFFLHINPGPGGTLLLTHHECEMWEHPKNQYELEIWKRDYDDESKWFIRGEVDIWPNRAVVMRSGLIHASDPKRGFGASAIDGRLILLCFFD